MSFYKEQMEHPIGNLSTTNRVLILPELASCVRGRKRNTKVL